MTNIYQWDKQFKEMGNLHDRKRFGSSSDNDESLDDTRNNFILNSKKSFANVFKILVF